MSRKKHSFSLQDMIASEIDLHKTNTVRVINQSMARVYRSRDIDLIDAYGLAMYAIAGALDSIDDVSVRDGIIQKLSETASVYQQDALISSKGVSGSKEEYIRMSEAIDLWSHRERRLAHQPSRAAYGHRIRSLVKQGVISSRKESSRKIYVEKSALIDAMQGWGNKKLSSSIQKGRKSGRQRSRKKHLRWSEVKPLVVEKGLSVGEACDSLGIRNAPERHTYALIYLRHKDSYDGKS